MVIDRKTDIALVRTALRRSRAVAILGPRQCGKTTLARHFLPPDSLNYFDLEEPQSLARLAEPATTLRPLKGLVVIDEIQRRPDLFPLLRVLADRSPIPARFLILGSASPDLIQQSSETLAGRLEMVPLEGFRLSDLGASAQQRHWLRGGFPLAYTARTETDSVSKAAAIPPDVPRARPSTTGNYNPFCFAMALLEHGRPLSWPDLERSRVGPRSSRQ